MLRRGEVGCPSFGHLQGKLDPEYSCQYRWTLKASLPSHGARLSKKVLRGLKRLTPLAKRSTCSKSSHGFHTREASPSLFSMRNLGVLLFYPALFPARKGNVRMQAIAGLPPAVCRRVPLIHLSEERQNGATFLVKE